MFLKNNKLKLKSETFDNRNKLSIDYYNLKDKSSFKEKILSDFIGDNLCLAIIDTKLQYNETKNDIEELISSIETMGFPYKKLVVKGEETLKVLGIAMKVAKDNKIKNYIVGFVFDDMELDKITRLQENYNIYYCIDDKYSKAEELLNKIQIYYEDEEEMLKDFQITIFNSSSFNNMSVSTNVEKVDFVNKTVDKYK